MSAWQRPCSSASGDRTLPIITSVLRDATDDDRDAVLAWRNHPQVRRASLTRHEIGADEHAQVVGRGPRGPDGAAS